MKKQTADNEKKIKVSTLVYGVLILAMFVLIVGSVLAYGTNTEIGTKIATKIATIVPFPAAVVDLKNVVYINDVEANLASVEKFYQTQDFAKEGLRIDFTTEDGKKRLRIKKREILDKIVEDKIIKILAKDRGVVISEKDADNLVTQKLNEFGTEDKLKEYLASSYGWDMEDFKKHVVLPTIYSEALSVKVATEVLDNTKAKSKIMEAQKQLKDGKDFAEVVRVHSEGSSKEKSGELGWARKDQVLPELQVALFGKDLPEKNAIIESSIGFHIVEIENRKKENDEELLQLRQIFVLKNNFADWLENEKKKMKVMVPMADFVWNKEKGAIDFRDEEMRKFEKEERAKAQGDASVTF